MIKEIKFKKTRILLGILFFTIYLITTLYVVYNPDGMTEHMHSKREYTQIIWSLFSVFPFSMMISFIIIFFRQKAIIITEKYLIDYSKYESLGKIKWTDITKIKRVKKTNIQIFLEPTKIKTNPFKTFLRFMTNWNYKDSILISSTLLDCEIDELYKVISTTYEKNNFKILKNN